MRDGKQLEHQQQVSHLQQPDGGNAHKETLAQLVQQLQSLIGLSSVKKEVETLINLAKVFAMRKEKGLPVPEISLHLVFSGNPGTGKTTVARIISKIYGELKLLSKGHLIEVDRSGLVGNYVGQTATKTMSVIERARGGILFIDEAYALSEGGDNDYGHEAIETLLKAMEDYREDLVVIAAGYADKMERFLASNPGLRSRFPRVILFPDYSAQEMMAIFVRMARTDGYRAGDGVKEMIAKEMQRRVLQRGKDFANARDVRNLFERIISMQANRIGTSGMTSGDALTTISKTDVCLALA
jgi:SpoVK/Ycf46/Vps4 family AAA+-type ATPase